MNKMGIGEVIVACVGIIAMAAVIVFMIIWL